MTKQSIFRVRSYGDSNTISGTPTSFILYTAQENVTIRRIIVRLAYNKDSGVVSESAALWQMKVNPNGNNVVDDLTIVGVNGDLPPYEYIMGGILPQTSRATDVTDNKGMRKLRSGDQIVLDVMALVSSGATTGNFVGYYVDIFFGQA